MYDFLPQMRTVFKSLPRQSLASAIGGFYTVGEHIGHLSKEIARMIAPLFDCINASGN